MKEKNESLDGGLMDQGNDQRVIMEWQKLF